MNLLSNKDVKENTQIDDNIKYGHLISKIVHNESKAYNKLYSKFSNYINNRGIKTIKMDKKDPILTVDDNDSRLADFDLKNEDSINNMATNHLIHLNDLEFKAYQHPEKLFNNSRSKNKVKHFSPKPTTDQKEHKNRSINRGQSNKLSKSKLLALKRNRGRQR